MKVRGWSRVYIVYACVLFVAGLIALPTSVYLSAAVSAPQELGFFEPIYGDADTLNGNERVVFTKSDCVAVTLSQTPFPDPPRAEPGSMEEILEVDNVPPVKLFQISCLGHQRRSEVILLILAAMFLPILMFAAGRWVKRGFVNA